MLGAMGITEEGTQDGGEQQQEQQEQEEQQPQQEQRPVAAPKPPSPEEKGGVSVGESRPNHAGGEDPGPGGDKLMEMMLEMMAEAQLKATAPPPLANLKTPRELTRIPMGRRSTPRNDRRSGWWS